MFRRFSANFAVLSIFLDILAVDAALLGAALLRAPLSVLPFLKPVPPVELPLLLYFVFPALWVGVLMLFSVYDGRKNLRALDEFGSLALGSLLAVVSLAGVLYLTYRDVSRFQFIMTAGIAISVMVLWRIGARVVFRRNGIHSRPRNVLILGAGEIGQQVAAQICAQPYLGLAMAGFLDDDETKRAARGDILGPLDDTRRVVQRMEIDDVVIALPLDAHQSTTQAVCDLYDLPVRVWVIPDYFSLSLHRAQIDAFAGVPMLDLRAPALSEYQRMVKRGFDLCLALLAAVPLLPLAAVIALAVRLDSPGPVFYRTRRIGENGREFIMYKFRTMVDGAERLLGKLIHTDEQGNLIHKTRHDPRVTRVGRFLRRTSLDELPQLINVIKGEMSLVGPRPELPELVERYNLWQRKRFAVPQGMTGWWQVNGRSDKPMHLHTEEDLFYVQNYSIWLDLHIIFRTVWVVLRGKGAF